jgi:hypothetical protein
MIAVNSLDSFCVSEKKVYFRAIILDFATIEATKRFNYVTRLSIIWLIIIERETRISESLLNHIFSSSDSLL